MYIQVGGGGRRQKQPVNVCVTETDGGTRSEAGALPRGAAQTQQEAGGDGAAPPGALHLPRHPGGGRQEALLQSAIFEEGRPHSGDIWRGPR